MKILIIEDDKQIVALLKKSLSSQSWIVESADSGIKGLRMIKNGTYSILILDLSLPGKNGQEILYEIRKAKISIPILILSVYSDIADKKHLFSLGADDYLTKPFLIEELILRIRALLRRPLKLEKKYLKLGSLSFDSEKNIFSRKGKEIYLTKKEHNLLLFFLKQKNKILSKGEILEHVWNYNSSPFSNSIETHIAGLRQKINIFHEPNIIHTFPGRGYKLSLKKIS